ncbi:MAG: META domain-containing protein, partial [Chitinophagaceae bacterium]
MRIACTLIAIFILSSCSNRRLGGSQPKQLVNRVWELSRILADTIHSPKPAYITFSDTLLVHGFSGCNGFSAVYNITEGKLQIGEIRSTRMYCDSLHPEQKLFIFLQRADGFVLSGDQLRLTKEG